MGTLLNQPPRYEASNILPLRDYIEDVEDYAKRISGGSKISVDQALEILRVAQERERVAYWKNDLDVRDEQLAGLGEILMRLVSLLDQDYVPLLPILRSKGE